MSTEEAIRPSSLTCTKPRREQYRRTEDEDAGGLADCHFDANGDVDLSHYERTGEVRYRPEPALFATVAVPIVPPDLFDELKLEPELVELARPLVDHFQDPVTPRTLPAVLSDRARCAIMACVYHMRHANRMRMRLPAEAPTDPRLPGYDLVESINKLMRLYKEERLARSGHRTAAHGVFPIDPANPSKGWRVQIWDTSKEKKNSLGEVVIGGKLHIAYKKTEQEAWKALAEWFWTNRRVDVKKYLCYRPEAGIAILAGLMGRAAQGHNDYVEVDAKEIYGGDDDWD